MFVVGYGPVRNLGISWGFTLLIGAFLGFHLKIPPKIVASIRAFGSGVLLSAISFDLLDEAYQLGGAPHLAAGFLVGALIFIAANLYLARRGAKHRKISSRGSGSFESNGAAIAAGSVLDGIPESISISYLTAFIPDGDEYLIK